MPTPAPILAQIYHNDWLTNLPVQGHQVVARCQLLFTRGKQASVYSCSWTSNLTTHCLKSGWLLRRDRQIPAPAESCMRERMAVHISHDRGGAREGYLS